MKFLAVIAKEMLIQNILYSIFYILYTLYYFVTEKW